MRTFKKLGLFLVQIQFLTPINILIDRIGVRFLIALNTKNTILLFFSCFLYIHLSAQKQDYIWHFGLSEEDQVLEEFRQDTMYGATKIDFHSDPPKIMYDATRIWDNRGANAIISSKLGELQLYTNAQSIYDGNHKIIEDTINYSQHWDNWTFVYNGELIISGLPTMQGVLLLPMPEKEDSVFLFYMQFNIDILKYDKLFLATLSKTSNSYKLDFRDSLLYEGEISGGALNAVQHANGRDWWILKSGKGNASFFKYLLTNKGLTFIEEQAVPTGFRSGFNQMFFSPKGDKLAYLNTIDSEIYGSFLGVLDFDRSSGELSNLLIDKYIDYTASLGLGVSFSPNGKLLYATDKDRLFQYDLEDDDIINSRITVAEYDGFFYYSPIDTNQVSGWPTAFGYLGLAPNGKIYGSSSSNNTRVMHIVNNPNLRGTACDVAQHSIHLPTKYSRTMPNFPNFRLGPLDGSEADTLGLDNHPVAKYRYVQDSLEDLRVHFFDLSYYDPVDYLWDFGDNNTSSDIEPNHTYAEKGVYDVCLTVSNIYDSNTSCKTMMLGTTSTDDKKYEVDISFYPNPTSDFLTINMHNYIAMDGHIRIYNTSGILIKSDLLPFASITIDLHEIPSGVYLFKVFDGRDELYADKIIKVD